MRVTLEVVGGPHTGKRVVLMSGQSATFGRTPQSDYQFANDLLMSSRHFAVVLKAESCVVRDLDSRNGTFVDGKRVLERELIGGSVILAGESRFAVTITPGATTAPPGTKEAAAVIGGQSPAPLAPLPPLAGLAAPSQVSSLLAAAPPLPRASAPLTSLPVNLPAAAGPPLASTKVATPHERWRASAPREFELALDDADPLVQKNALLAAVWKGQRWALDYCRAVAARPLAENYDALLMLAILGTPEDLPRIQSATRLSDLGPERFALLGSYGHPHVMGYVLAGLVHEDPASRLAAGAAFTKMTGQELRLLGNGELPDVEAAAAVWRKLQSTHPRGERWCRGRDVSRGISPEELAQFDLESRWEICLRGQLAGNWKTTPLDREQLAQRLHG